ncbi:spore germination protein GerPE [Gordoniibacillus kamchatkensis]|uniref:spore germination protein GerPE n=1 Tax=Gordoniibacillus kamchatkensis TaxID=1590651 RepID=UPI0006968718|nr:spore germination protein GerPE [Paenibacillus sp. VKM B-2647]
MRTSVVGSLKVLAVIFQAVIHVGDTRYIQAKTNAFALQRQIADFEKDEFPLEQFPMFRRPIPRLSPAENVRMVKRDTVPFITVGAVKINAASTSAVVQIGSNVCIDLESRIKHIRQFTPPAGGAAAGAVGAGGMAPVPLAAPGAGR